MQRATAHAWLVAALCLGLASGVYAQEQDESSQTDVSGSLRLSYFSSSRDLNAVENAFTATSQFKVRHDLAEQQRLEFDARLLAEDLTHDAHIEASLASAYWFARMGNVDLRFGQQRVRWGKADGINPTDFFTPVDFSILLPLEDDRYRSIPALRADVQLSDSSSVSLVVESGFTPGRVPQAKPALLALRDDEPSSSELQYGARWLYTGNNLDWSLSAFRGFATQPVLSADPAAAMQGLAPLVRYYPSITGVGADVARNFGKYGFRAELAYTEVDSPAGRQSIGSNVFLVAGIDRSLGDWNINVQALLRYTPDLRRVTATAIEQQVAAAQNSIVHMQQQQFTSGMSARIGVSALNQTLQAELLVVGFFDPGNCLVRPLLSYSLSDRRKVRVGAEYYVGPDLSVFGSLQRNRTVFLELQQFY